jgi:hypothetical protein
MIGHLDDTPANMKALTSYLLLDLLFELYALLFKFLITSDAFGFEVPFSKNPLAYVLLVIPGRVRLDCRSLHFFVVYDAFLR